MDNNLEALRRKAGFKTAADFAKRLGVSRPTVSMWESGQREMSLDRACDICDILGCTLDELAGRRSMSLSTEEQQLIRDFRSTDARGQAAILAIAQVNRGIGTIPTEKPAVIYGNDG